MRYFACTVVVPAKDSETARHLLNDVIVPQLHSNNSPKLVATGLPPDSFWESGHIDTMSDEKLPTSTGMYRFTPFKVKADGTLCIDINHSPNLSLRSYYIRSMKRIDFELDNGIGMGTKDEYYKFRGMIEIKPEEIYKAW